MQIELSKHNIISKLEGSDDFFIVNLLSGNADILTESEAEKLQNLSVKDSTEYISKGYLVNSADEERQYKKAYLDFVDQRDTDEIQLFFSPTYTCNFNCTYCYQVEYESDEQQYDKRVVDAFFHYILNTFSDRKKYITLFGGEPLLASPNHKDYISYFLQKAKTNNLEVAIVTNGYLLDEYIPLFSDIRLREIQVTLDGLEEKHNNRRPLKNNKSTFERIVKGIDLALKNTFPINLRMVVDKENLDELPKLAEFAINKGWTEQPHFKTQLGRNYELHYCQHNQKKLYNRIELYQDIYHLLKKYPYIEKFHKPAFSISKFLFEQGELPNPLFDSCPGTKTEWAFDYTGDIFACTATVGKPGEKLGTFFPVVNINEELIDEWRERDVLSIKACENCNLQLACGGGCASVAKNDSGELLSADCRPIKELLELGISYYHSTN